MESEKSYPTKVQVIRSCKILRIMSRLLRIHFKSALGEQDIATIFSLRGAPSMGWTFLERELNSSHHLSV